MGERPGGGARGGERGNGGSQTQPGSFMHTPGLSAGPLLAEWALWWTLSIFKVSDRTWSSANWLLHFPKSLAAWDITEKNHRPPNRHPTSSFDARSLYQVFPATVGGPGRSAFLRAVARSREAGPTGRAGLAPGCGALGSPCQESAEVGRHDLRMGPGRQGPGRETSLPRCSPNLREPPVMSRLRRSWSGPAGGPGWNETLADACRLRGDGKAG